MITDFYKPRNDSSLHLQCPTVSRAAARSATKELDALPESQKTFSIAGTKRGVYQLQVVSETNKAKVAKYASQQGVSASLRHFKVTGEFPDLKESTVRGWMAAWRKESKKLNDSRAVSAISSKTRGRPLLLGEELESQVKAFLQSMRLSGGVVNAPIASAVARGIVISHDSNLLAENGGSINLSRDWAKRLLNRIGLVKRKANTSASKVMPKNFDALKEQYLADIRTVVQFEEIPPPLIINWDHTAIKYVPVSNWTFHTKGAKRVEVHGVDDKRQITAVLAGTLSGAFLPPQLIYKGKTPACLPKFDFPETWDLAYNDSHWANESTTLRYFEKVLFPYVDDVRRKHSLPLTQPALAIFDHFKGQLTNAAFLALEGHNILPVTVPANCTDRLQPMDLSVNKSIKDKLRSAFQLWYAAEVKQQIDEDKELQKPVDLKLSRMKPLGAEWFVSAFNHLESSPQIVRNGFQAAGIEHWY